MPAQPTTRAQVNGYRFLLRRLDHAMVRRDVRMLHDPMRSQVRSVIVGAILGVLLLAGCAILAFLRPQGAIGSAHIVAGKDSGALYVIVGNRLHPVLNLASARLIVGSAESPASVKDAKLASMPRGPILGIPGAPAALPGSTSGAVSTWTLCESTVLSPSGSAAASPGVITTVSSAKPVLGKGSRPLAGGQALLVTRAGKTYLLFDGQRAEVDPRNSSVVRALGLGGVTPRPVGVGLLNAAEEVPPLAPPVIPQLGQPAGGRLAGMRIGAVVQVAGVQSSELYVIVPGGVQRISPLAADMIRDADSEGSAEIATVPPDLLDGVPVLDILPVDRFPATAPKILRAEVDPVACIAWASPADNRDATVQFLAGSALPIPASAAPVSLATADETGDRVDAVYVPPASGEFVQITDIAPGSVRRESLYYVADNGVRYGVPDMATAAILGLEAAPRLAPWQIVGQLVPGPSLSRADAMVGWDVLPQADGPGS